MNDVRYVWDIADGRKIYSSIPFNKDNAIELPMSKDKIFVNILSVAKGDCNTYYNVKLFYSDGRTFEGWQWDGNMPINLFNIQELFDGRFNA